MRRLQPTREAKSDNTYAIRAMASGSYTRHGAKRRLKLTMGGAARISGFLKAVWNSKVFRVLALALLGYLVVGLVANLVFAFSLMQLRYEARGNYSDSEIAPGDMIQVAVVNASLTCPDGWSGNVSEYDPMPKWALAVTSHFDEARYGLPIQTIDLSGPDGQKIVVTPRDHDALWKRALTSAEANDDRLLEIGGPFRGVQYDAFNASQNDGSISVSIYIRGSEPGKAVPFLFRADIQDGETVEDAVARLASEINLEFH